MGGVPRPEPPEPSRCSVQALVSPCECFACFLPSLQPCTWGRNQCRTARSVQDVCTVVTVRISSPDLVEAVAALGNKVVESLRAQDPSEGLGLFPNVCVVLTGAGSELTSPRPTPAGRGGRGGARRSVSGSSGCSRPCSEPCHLPPS